MIIGLTGYIGVGKTDVAARHLIEMYGFRLVCFKDALIEEVKKNFSGLLEQIAYVAFFDQGLDKADALEKLWQKPYHPLLRTLLQNYGTEVRRGDSHEYWVNRYWQQVSRVGTGTPIVTDDVRFANEAESIRRSKSGYIVRIVRSGFEGSAHASESEQDLIIADHTIHNDGQKSRLMFSIAEFYGKVI